MLLEVIEDLQRKKFEDNLLSKSDDNEKRKAKIEAFKKKLEEEKIKDFGLKTKKLLSSEVQSAIFL